MSRKSREAVEWGESDGQRASSRGWEVGVHRVQNTRVLWAIVMTLTSTLRDRKPLKGYER